MKVIDLNQSQPTLSDLLTLASEENLVLKTPEGKEFVLAEADDFEREVSLVRGNRELMELLEQRSRATSKVSLKRAKELLQADDE